MDLRDERTDEVLDGLPGVRAGRRGGEAGASDPALASLGDADDAGLVVRIRAVLEVVVWIGAVAYPCGQGLGKGCDFDPRLLEEDDSVVAELEIGLDVEQKLGARDAASGRMEGPQVREVGCADSEPRSRTPELDRLGHVRFTG